MGGDVVTLTDENNLAGGLVELNISFDTRVTGQTPDTPFTIVRTRGILNVFPNIVTASQFIVGAYGICVVNGEAFDAGVASVISPWSESFDSRWFYHTFWSIAAPFGTGSGPMQMATQIIEIDSKSMRKIERGDVIVSVIENASTDSCAFFSNYRQLMKLT